MSKHTIVRTWTHDKFPVDPSLVPEIGQILPSNYWLATEQPPEGPTLIHLIHMEESDG